MLSSEVASRRSPGGVYWLDADGGAARCLVAMLQGIMVQSDIEADLDVKGLVLLKATARYLMLFEIESQLEGMLSQTREQASAQKEELKSTKAALDARMEELASAKAALDAQKAELASTKAALSAQQEEVIYLTEKVRARDWDLASTKALFSSMMEEHEYTESQAASTERSLQQLKKRFAALEKSERALRQAPPPETWLDSLDHTLVQEVTCKCLRHRRPHNRCGESAIVIGAVEITGILCKERALHHVGRDGQPEEDDFEAREILTLQELEESLECIVESECESAPAKPDWQGA